MDEFYDLLQVPRDASDAKIKKAYHRMSLKLHPDKGGDPKEFQKLKQAYEVLSDKEKRQQYDSVGLDIEENDGDDQMFASESKEILQIIGAFAIRTFIGLIFMFFIYYTVGTLLADGICFCCCCCFVISMCLQPNADCCRSVHMWDIIPALLLANPGIVCAQLWQMVFFFACVPSLYHITLLRGAFCNF
jgi:hypothetical protein